MNPRNIGPLTNQELDEAQCIIDDGRSLNAVAAVKRLLDDPNYFNRGGTRGDRRRARRAVATSTRRDRH
jgi:hypothetical protein